MKKKIENIIGLYEMGTINTEEANKKLLDLFNVTVSFKSSFEKDVKKEINRLREEKSRYMKDECQYSWNIANDECCVWEKALELLKCTCNE